MLKKIKNSYANIIFIVIIIIFVGGMLLIGLREGLELTEIPLKKIAFNFTWRDSILYIFGFIFTLVAVLVCFLEKAKPVNTVKL